MSVPFLLGLVTVSSMIVGVLALRTGLSPRMAKWAGLATLEFAGLWILCLMVDLALGAAVILGLRTLTHSFVSIYVLNDVSLVVMSALQAFALYAWFRFSQR